MVDDINNILIMRGEPRPGVYHDPVVVTGQQLIQLRVVQRALRLIVHKRPKHVASSFERLGIACGRGVALLLRAHRRPAAVNVFAHGEASGRNACNDVGPVDGGG